MNSNSNFTVVEYRSHALKSIFSLVNFDYYVFCAKFLCFLVKTKIWTWSEY